MSKFNCTLTAERARQLFNYDPATGVLTRRVQTSNNVKVGDVVGSPGSNCYFRVSADGDRYLVHRVVWLHYYGVWPTQILDHKDRCQTNNRIKNLQDVNASLNMQNRGAGKSSTSAVRGVSWDKYRNKWKAQIMHNGKVINLGRCDTEEKAGDVYLAAAKLYHSNSNPANLK